MFVSGDIPKTRRRGRPLVWKEPYVQTTVRITGTRMEWLRDKLKHDRRMTPSYIVNTAIDQLMKKEQDERDLSDEEIKAMLEERRKAHEELEQAAGVKP